MQHEASDRATSPQVRYGHEVQKGPYTLSAGLRAMMAVYQSGLYVWYNGCDFCVARSEEDARQLLRETLGAEYDTAGDGWRMVPHNGVVEYRPSPSAAWSRKEAWRWIEAIGRNWLGAQVRF